MGDRWRRYAGPVAAWLLLVNGLLGLGVALWNWHGVPWLALLGVLAGGVSLRGAIAGAWGGIVFYGLQLASYFPYAGSWSFGYRAGLSLGYVARLPDGVLVVNLAALALLMLSAALVLRRAGVPGRPARWPYR